MKTLSGFAALVIAIVQCGALANGPPSPVQNTKATVQEQILAREKDYTNGILHGDINLLKTVFGKNFVDTGSNGHLRKRDEMLAILAKATRPSSIVEKNRRIAVYGSTAIVTVEFIVTSIDNGKTERFHGRATDVWVIEDGSWRCVAAHSSEIKKRANLTAGATATGISTM
jgi:hypothetical protein